MGWYPYGIKRDPKGSFMQLLLHKDTIRQWHPCTMEGSQDESGCPLIWAFVSLVLWKVNFKFIRFCYSRLIARGKRRAFAPHSEMCLLGLGSTGLHQAQYNSYLRLWICMQLAPNKKRTQKDKGSPVFRFPLCFKYNKLLCVKHNGMSLYLEFRLALTRFKHNLWTISDL